MDKMRVYLASVFADKDRVKLRSDELAALGIECTSRWALETAPHNCKITDKPAQYMRETAVYDVEDIVKSDKVVLTVPSPAMLMDLTPHQMSRGGRVFESGMMYGMILAEYLAYGKDFVASVGGYRRELIVMGDKENVFHFLDGIEEAAKYPAVITLPNWHDVKCYLVAQMREK